MIFYKRKNQFKQEKTALKAQFEQEILTSQNEIQEETMRYISRELHDNVVQMLVVIKMQLSILNEKPSEKRFSQLNENVNTAINDLRSLSKTLNTENILHEGLAKTIRFELKRLEKAVGIKVELHEIGEQYRLNQQQEIIIFRIFQELIQNILKHAQAKNIVVLLEENQEFFKLELKDDGIGFDFDEKIKNKGFESGGGLANMSYRAGLLKGTLQVSRVESGGSLSVLIIPISK